MDEFEDSSEATDFMEELSGKITDERLHNWAADTDSLCCTKTAAKLQEAEVAYQEFLEMMNKASEM